MCHCGAEQDHGAPNCLVPRAPGQSCAPGISTTRWCASLLPPEHGRSARWTPSRVAPGVVTAPLTASCCPDQEGPAVRSAHKHPPSAPPAPSCPTAAKAARGAQLGRGCCVAGRRPDPVCSGQDHTTSCVPGWFWRVYDSFRTVSRQQYMYLAGLCAWQEVHAHLILAAIQVGSGEPHAAHAVSAACMFKAQPTTRCQQAHTPIEVACSWLQQQHTRTRRLRQPPPPAPSLLRPPPPTHKHHPCVEILHSHSAVVACPAEALGCPAALVCTSAYSSVCGGSRVLLRWRASHRGGGRSGRAPAGAACWLNCSIKDGG